jgi:hypothetical protein
MMSIGRESTRTRVATMWGAAGPRTGVIQEATLMLAVGLLGSGWEVG